MNLVVLGLMLQSNDPRISDGMTRGFSRLVLFSQLYPTILVAHAAGAFAGPPLRIA
jgi:hypothetical protein